jgi:hypothetical protein
MLIDSNKIPIVFTPINFLKYLSLFGKVFTGLFAQSGLILPLAVLQRPLPFFQSQGLLLESTLAEVSFRKMKSAYL